VFAAQHLLDLGGLDLLAERVERLGEVRGHLFALPRPIDEDADVVDLARQLVAQFEVVGQTTAPLQRLLRLGRVFPEIRSGDSLL
jgi:hypothetical protein